MVCPTFSNNGTCFCFLMESGNMNHWSPHCKICIGWWTQTFSISARTADRNLVWNPSSLNALLRKRLSYHIRLSPQATCIKKDWIWTDISLKIFPSSNGNTIRFDLLQAYAQDEDTIKCSHLMSLPTKMPMAKEPLDHFASPAPAGLILFSFCFLGFVLAKKAFAAASSCGWWKVGELF